jgi:hypothetical protein
MKRFVQLPMAAYFLVSVFVGGGVLAVGESRRWYRPQAPPTEQMKDWDCRDLVDHLHASGLPYRAMSTSENGSWERNVYLTRSGRNWSDLNTAPKVREHIDAWRGAVYCEKASTPWRREEQMRDWGDCCVYIGPFVIFGDRSMLAEIQTSLANG